MERHSRGGKSCSKVLRLELSLVRWGRQEEERFKSRCEMKAGRDL